jgi:hypothetical protein
MPRVATARPAAGRARAGALLPPLGAMPPPPALALLLLSLTGRVAAGPPPNILFIMGA